MTSKERVHRALQRKPVDRVPIFMWYHPQTRRRLGKLLDIPPEYVPQVMGDDIRQAWVSNNHPMEGIVHERDGQSHMDDWGVEWTRIDGFNQISRYPLAHAGTADSAIPVPLRPGRSARGPDEAGDEIQGGLLRRLRCLALRLRNVLAPAGDGENVDGDGAPAGAERRNDARCTEFSIALSEAACRRFDLDWLWLGDDAGASRPC